MTRWAWTGSRGPLLPNEIARVTLDVATTIRPGDSVGTGGASGVDEWVLRTALQYKKVIGDIHIVVFPADGERSWPETRADMDVIRACDEVHWREKGWKYLERDRALVDWSECVVAMPLMEFFRTQQGAIHVPRGSGTAYTARYADSLNKLVATHSLRDGKSEYRKGFGPLVKAGN